MTHPISLSAANALYGTNSMNGSSGSVERTFTSAGSSSFANNTVFTHSQNQSRQLENLNDGLDSLIDAQMDLYKTSQTNNAQE